MGKRSNLNRLGHDAYDTPLSATWPLLIHLEHGVRFAEPCAGRGALVNNLTNNGLNCCYAGDVAPRARWINKRSALDLTRAELGFNRIEMIITNPPWTHELLMPLIAHFMTLRPSWLLLGADWMHNKRSAALLDRCSKVIAIGRVKWIEGSRYVGKDNCCWYYFPQQHRGGPIMIGRFNGA